MWNFEFSALENKTNTQIIKNKFKIFNESETIYGLINDLNRLSKGDL